MYAWHNYKSVQLLDNVSDKFIYLGACMEDMISLIWLCFTRSFIASGILWTTVFNDCMVSISIHFILYKNCFSDKCSNGNGQIVEYIMHFLVLFMLEFHKRFSIFRFAFISATLCLSCGQKMLKGLCTSHVASFWMPWCGRELLSWLVSWVCWMLKVEEI